MRKVLFLTTLAAFLLTSSTWAADISGKWTFTWWGAGAEESFSLDIKAAGENLTITGNHPTFKEMTGTGTLKGDSVSMSLKSASMEIALTGKVTGNKMAGAREIKASGGSRGAQGGAPGDSAGAPQGGQAGAPGGSAPGGAQGGQVPGGQGAPGSAQGAPQGQAGQGGAQAQSSENWTAVKN